MRRCLLHVRCPFIVVREVRNDVDAKRIPTIANLSTVSKRTSSPDEQTGSTVPQLTAQLLRTLPANPSGNPGMLGRPISTGNGNIFNNLPVPRNGSPNMAAATTRSRRTSAFVALEAATKCMMSAP
jgi:hypothetical protein